MLDFMTHSQHLRSNMSYLFSSESVSIYNIQPSERVTCMSRSTVVTISNGSWEMLMTPIHPCGSICQSSAGVLMAELLNEIMPRAFTWEGYNLHAHTNLRKYLTTSKEDQKQNAPSYPGEPFNNFAQSPICNGPVCCRIGLHSFGI